MGSAAGATGGLAGAASAATPYVTMGLGAVNVATDLMQAGKQADASRAAEQAAQVAARKEEQLRSQNMFEALQAPMEQYNRAGREITSQIGQSVAALQEGDPRLLAGGLGKVNAVGVDAEAATRDAAANDLYKIGIAQAQSGMNVNSNLADLQADRLTGAQLASKEADNKSNLLLQQAGSTGAGLLNQGLGMIKSFGSDGEAPISSLDVAGMAPAGMAPAQQLQNMSNSNIAAFNNANNPKPSWMNSLSFLKKGN